MKFSILIFTIAMLLEYNEADKRKIKMVGLFKQHALQLVEATVEQFRKTDQHKRQFMLLCDSCSGIIENEPALATLHIIIAGTSIALKHSQNLTQIRNASNNEAISYVSDEMMNYIEKIFNICSRTVNGFSLTPVDDVLQLYVNFIIDSESTNPFEHFSILNANEPSCVENQLTFATSCFELTLIIDYNLKFFKKYIQGFSIICEEMRERQDKPLMNDRDYRPDYDDIRNNINNWRELKTIAEEIKTTDLKETPDEHMDKKYEQFRQIFSNFDELHHENNETVETLRENENANWMKAMIFLKIAASIFAAKAITWGLKIIFNC